MLAILVDEPFSDEDWIYERKLDGERCIVHKKGKSVKLLSRNKKNLNNTYPEIQEAFKKQEGNFIIDGEIVAFKGKVTSFQKLQERMLVKNRAEAKEKKVKVFFYAFDIMFADGYELKKLPLTERKKKLKEKIDFENPIRYTPHKKEVGEDFFEEACGKHWEGLIAKDCNSKYVSSRSKKWLKFKCVNQQEFVIGGYTDPQGERIGFGALLIGYYKRGELVYAGKVGTGYDDQTLEYLYKKMKRLERESSPFSTNSLSSDDINWVSPLLVAAVGFSEWTEDDKLRHPRYLGLRNDKDPEKIRKEK